MISQLFRRLAPCGAALPTHAEVYVKGTCLRAINIGCLLTLMSAAGCAHASGQILTPDGHTSVGDDEQQTQSGAVLHNLRNEQGASFHVLRVRSQQAPQELGEHELVLFVMKGKLKLHLDDKTFMIDVGDVVEIPRGTTHWVENAASAEGIAYVVITPPFTGEGRKVVGSANPKRVSAWRWTRWGN